MPCALSTLPSLLFSANALEPDVFNASGSPAKLTSSNFNVAAAEKGPSRREIKKERETKWKAWCLERRWSEEDDPMYKQKAGASEVHRSDAMAYFRLKDYEIDTLPCVYFGNTYNPDNPGRSYNRGNLCTLVSRKFAVLGGVDSEIDPKTKEDEFLRRGWTLFQENTRELETRAKKSGKPRKPLHEWTIVQCGLWGTAPLERNIKPRPVGSWTTPEYVDGVLVGWWLNFQFDPDAEDYEDFYGSFVRFRPIDADWDWGYVPTNDK